MRRLTKRAGRAAASLCREVVSVFGRVKAGRDSWKRVAAQRWRLSHVRDGIVVRVKTRRSNAGDVPRSGEERRRLSGGYEPVQWTPIWPRRSATGRAQGQDRRPEGSVQARDNWALRVRLQMENRVRQLALFNLGIDSKLRGCDLVALKVRDVCHGDQLASRAVVLQLR